MKLDIIRTSASRPELLEKSTKSLEEKVIWSGEKRIFFHEDVLNKKGSAKCLQFAQDAGFDEISWHDPPITQGPSIDFLFKKVETEFFFNVEDDWEAVATIDLDLCVKIMKENPNVNQIAFHKRKIQAYRYTWPKRVVEKSGVKLTTNPHWAFTPSIARTSFLRRFWSCPPPGRNPVWFINPKVKRQPYPCPKDQVMRSPDWMMKYVGAYFFGPIGGEQMMKHLGFQNSVRAGEREWKE